MKKNYKILAIGGLVAAVAVGGTFAYYTASQTFKNPFNATNYSTTSYEVFNPTEGDKWEPGGKVDKKVFGRNTGEGDVYVRIKFDEHWTNTNGQKTDWDSSQDNFYVDSAAKSKQLVPDNGEITGDGTVVYKKLENVLGESDSRPKTNDTDMKSWVKGSDGWYYYTRILKTDESTAPLLTEVTLCEDTDMGLYHDFAAFTIIDKDMTNYESIIPTLKTDAAGNVSIDNAQGKTWYTLKDFDGAIPMNVKDQPEDAEAGIYPLDEAGNPITTYKWETQTIYTHKAHVLDTNHAGYADADYNLNITVEYVQADRDNAAIRSMLSQEAGDDGWEWYPGKEADDAAAKASTEASEG